VKIAGLEWAVLAMLVATPIVVIIVAVVLVVSLNGRKAPRRGFDVRKDAVAERDAIPPENRV